MSVWKCRVSLSQAEAVSKKEMSRADFRNLASSSLYLIALRPPAPSFYISPAFFYSFFYAVDSLFHLAEPSLPSAPSLLTRSKDRISYSHQLFTVDLTQVSQPATADQQGKPMLHELEIEFKDARVLLAEAAKEERGEDNQYLEMVQVFLNNVRELTLLLLGIVELGNDRTSNPVDVPSFPFPLSSPRLPSYRLLHFLSLFFSFCHCSLVLIAFQSLAGPPKLCPSLASPLTYRFNTSRPLKHSCTVHRHAHPQR